MQQKLNGLQKMVVFLLLSIIFISLFSYNKIHKLEETVEKQDEKFTNLIQNFDNTNYQLISYIIRKELVSAINEQNVNGELTEKELSEYVNDIFDDDIIDDEIN